MEAQEIKERCGSFKPQQPHCSWDRLWGLYFFTSYARVLPPSALPSWKFRLGPAQLHLLCLRLLASMRACTFLPALPKLREA